MRISVTAQPGLSAAVLERAVIPLRSEAAQEPLVGVTIERRIALDTTTKNAGSDVSNSDSGWRARTVVSRCAVVQKRVVGELRPAPVE